MYTYTQYSIGTNWQVIPEPAQFGTANDGDDAINKLNNNSPGQKPRSLKLSKDIRVRGTDERGEFLEI